MPKSVDNDITPRERIVRSAAHLMRERGIKGIGMREIVEAADAPRGSLQRYFPGGKMQLIEEAINYALREVPRGYGAAIRTAPTVQDAVRMILEPWRKIMIDFEFRAGCPVVPVVVEGIDDDQVRKFAIGAYEGWIAAVQKVLFTAFEFDEDEAREFASGLVSGIEGAVIVARATRSLAPIDDLERLFGRLGEGRARRLPLTDNPSLA